MKLKLINATGTVQRVVLPNVTQSVLVLIDALMTVQRPTRQMVKRISCVKIPTTLDTEILIVKLIAIVMEVLSAVMIILTMEELAEDMEIAPPVHMEVQCMALPLASLAEDMDCLLYTSPSPRDRTRSRMPSSA